MCWVSLITLKLSLSPDTIRHHGLIPSVVGMTEHSVEGKSGHDKTGFVSVFQKLYLLVVDLLFTDEEKGLGLNFFKEETCMVSAKDQSGVSLIQMSFTTEWSYEGFMRKM